MFMRDQTAFQAATALRIPFAPQPRDEARRGLVGGARVETDRGWLDIRSVMPGMRVATLDGGFALVRGLSVRTSLGGEEAVHFPGGSLGNCAGLDVMPDSGIVLSDPLAEELFESVDVVVPARALAGRRGIALRPLAAGQAIVELHFDAEEAVYANTGILLHARPGENGQGRSEFTWLTEAQGRALVRLVEGGAGLEG
ncbi:MAG: Hint domain-containing protein [Rhodobacteraceae bacterium]|nr:Hint domain-containing protein [Paracoccaceae bacterium]